MSPPVVVRAGAIKAVPSVPFDGPSSPHELPSGRVVCSAHRLVVCPYCCSDYSFMDEVLGYNSDQVFEEDEDDEYDDDDDDDDNDDYDDYDSDSSEDHVPDLESIPGLNSYEQDRKPRIGTGRVLFQKFKKPRPTDTPSSLFPPGVTRNSSPLVNRFIRRDNPTELLIYTDGACLDNGHANARAGCGFVFSPNPGPSAYCNFRLENKGPTGEVYQPTSNRAELRAVIAALRFRAWNGEGFRSIVIATDSEYVVDGATGWVRKWLRNGWKTHIGAPVKNKDLWQVLLGEAERWSDRGVKVQFWWIPRDQNIEADHWARHGANMQDIPDQYGDILGVLV